MSGNKFKRKHDLYSQVHGKDRFHGCIKYERILYIKIKSFEMVSESGGYHKMNIVCAPLTEELSFFVLKFKAKSLIICYCLPDGV